MFHKISCFFANLSLRVKLMLSTALCFSVLFAISAFVSLNLVSRNSQALLHESLLSESALSTQTLADLFSDVENLSYQILASDTIQRTLSNIYYMDSSSADYNPTISQAVSSIRSELSSLQWQYESVVKSISLKANVVSSRSSQSKPLTLDEEELQALINNADLAAGAPSWSSPSHGELFLSRQIREVQGTRFTNLGTILLQADLTKILDRATGDADSCMLYSGRQFFSYPSWMTLFDAVQVQQIFSSDDSTYHILDLNDTRYFVCCSSVPGKENWKYVKFVDYQAFADSIKSTRITYVLVILGTLAFSVLLTWLILNHAIAGLHDLVLKMQRFHGQQEPIPFSGPDYSWRTDEIGILHQQFDEMVDEIQNLIHVSYTNELLRKDAQLRALEMQINPHFLYNTLESINWRAKASGSKEISQMVEALGSLLRKTLSRKNLHGTLQEELDIVRYFMTIMDLRFEDRLVYTIESDPTLLSAEIPRLTLQPLVENATNYALEEMIETCYINIQAERIDSRPGYFSICVRNTGTQFEDDLLKKLREKQIQPRGLGIGLLNIEERLRLTFGDSFQFRFYNEDEYAVAQIILPIRQTDI
ncbi:MAG: sensor histidine kinase [Cuneatibacter sp.]|nr:sensor histidine kinase [Cuneatibacter sp.]